MNMLSEVAVWESREDNWLALILKVEMLNPTTLQSHRAFNSEEA